jgi:hypothetical protein
VADPDKVRLEAALRRIAGLVDEYQSVLDPSCRLMEDSTWVGPAGRRFGDGVHDDRREVRAQLSRAEEEARRALKSLSKP